MDFNVQMPDWKNEGNEPSDTLKESGFAEAKRVPANILNWIISLPIRAIKELQEKLSGHAEDTANPHGVTAAQVGLDKVNNTPDSEKNVAFASEAGVARKVEYDLTVRFKGGDTEGTNKWTYNGSTSRSVNITPEKIQAAEKDLGNVADEDVRKKAETIINATSTDGISYTATLDGVTELVNGMEITIIPNTKSTGTAITLNLNGMGAKPIRRPLSFSTFVATSIDSDRTYFLSENTPCRLMYHANYTTGGIWLMADKVKYSAQDLYGTTPVDSGGTGKSTITTGNFLVGNGTEAMVEKTPQEVLEILTGKSDISDLVVGGANWSEYANHPAMHDCSNTDINELTTSGFYFGYTGMTNAAVNEISVFEVIPYSKDWVLQRQTRLTDGKSWMRYKYSGTAWSDWSYIYTSAINDAAKIVTGTYTGNSDGETHSYRTISTPFEPRIVIINSKNITQGFSGKYGNFFAILTPYLNGNFAAFLYYDANEDCEETAFGQCGGTITSDLNCFRVTCKKTRADYYSCNKKDVIYEYVAIG